MKIKTLQDLQQYAYERHMNLEKMRFMLGANTYEPKYFGIYFDEKSNEWVVYKNKADGKKVERYRGYDENIAVNILFDKMNEEIALRGGNAAYKTSSKHLEAHVNFETKPAVDTSDLDVFDEIDQYLKNHQTDASIMQISVGKRSFEADDLGIFRNASSEYVIYYVDQNKITKTLMKTPYKQIATDTFVELINQRVLEGVGEVDMSMIQTSYAPQNNTKDLFKVSNQRKQDQRKKKAGITTASIALTLGGIAVVSTIAGNGFNSNYLEEGYYLVDDDLYYHYHSNWYELDQEKWYPYHDSTSLFEDAYVGYEYLTYSDPLAFTNSLIYKNDNHREGYYHKDEDLYYLLDDQFYYYNNGGWILYDEPYDGDWYDYYYGDDYYFDEQEDSFYESDYYEDYYSDHYSSSSSYDDDDDDDWDWSWDDDDDDDWGFFDDWDSDDSDWDSDW